MRSRGGGVLVAISRKLSSSIVTIGNTSSIENFQDISILDLHVNALSEARLKHPSSGVIFLGDFNQPQLLWIPGQGNNLLIDPSSVISRASASLVDGTILNGMHQRNGVRDLHNRTLDLVFTDESILISTIIEANEVVVPIDVHHPPVEFDISFPNPVAFIEDFDASARDFRRADFEVLNRALSEIDWTNLQRCADVDMAVSTFCSIMSEVFDNSVPLVRPPLRPPWTNNRLKQLKHIRSKWLRLFSRSRCPFLKTKLNDATRRYRIYNRLCYRRYLDRTQSNLRRNPKAFWKFVNTKRKESGLPAVLHLKDRTAQSSAEKCNLFANHFSSVFPIQSLSTDEIDAAVTLLPRDVLDLDVFAITEEMVIDAINNLKFSTSAGKDGIPSCILKRCSAVLVKPLTHIFNLSFEQQKFPAIWKRSFMSPIFKKGDKQDVRNYRGVTSLAACSKVLERIVNDFSHHSVYPISMAATKLMPYILTLLPRLIQ
ncbi:uncharacterized protein LOC129743095 [Uranotaenia lowii]|uniref:uncharacterized protein LOC129743095 n=1 Tax=Uranotaenia lowii TaxID=190385 RepID=UPI00247A2A15|nr:uncharacterized protein LOC129743095 [Uranotaenia lowii]